MVFWKTKNGGMNWDSEGLLLPRTGKCKYGNYKFSVDESSITEKMILLK
ncbi:MAG: hypothetical protein ABSF32_02440 [Ignavibacteria bacterium]|jgi:hypothetical protein